MKDIVNLQQQPYILGGQLSSCESCQSDAKQAHFCSFHMYGDPPTCPKLEQEVLLDYWIKQAAAGSTTASGLLTMTPCDLWPYLSGRTMWYAVVLFASKHLVLTWDNQWMPGVLP